MRLSAPRIDPIPPEAWPEEIQRYSQGTATGGVPNVIRTLANHPELMRRWMVFANHILGKSTLEVRERELLMLRIGWLCQSVYEFGQHTQIAKRAGISDAEIKAVTVGPSDPSWGEFDRTLLTAVDELKADGIVSDATWAALGARYNTQQLMDVVFTVGQYNLVSWALNSFGVQLDEGVPGFPA
ncbi:MAG: carboxymuconolactone decarboxylase family protein [Acidimicrobiales bacterium]